MNSTAPISGPSKIAGTAEDHDHHQIDALQQVERQRRGGAQERDLQAAADAGDGGGDREHRKLVREDVDAARGRHRFVLADGDERSAEVRAH